MGGEHRIYGLMAGITIGFAVWGSQGIAPQKTPQQETVKMQPGYTTVRICSENTAEAASEIAAGNPAGTAEILLHAQSAVLMDGDTGRILYEKNGEQVRPMASTTKIMTCILALECGSPEEICTVSALAAAQPKVHLGAGKGKRFYLKDLLRSLMLESHNDTAVMIAEQIGGSVEGFAAMMNQKARDLGCRDTCFITPNGLDATVTGADGKKRIHGTTARDLAAIMRYCVMQSPKKEAFLEVTRTPDYSFSDVDGSGSYSCRNHNALLTMMDGVLSGKTGFTGGAGYSYVSALESEGRTYILALLGCGWPPHKAYKWSDARALFSYGKENYQLKHFHEKQETVRIPVEGGICGDWRTQAKEGQVFINDDANVLAAEAVPDKERDFSVLLSEQETLTRRAEFPKTLTAPVRKGELIGHVSYSLGDLVVRTYPLYAEEEAERRGLKHCIRQTVALFLLPEP